jgi:hypothetical protein
MSDIVQSEEVFDEKDEVLLFEESIETLNRETSPRLRER